MPQTPPPYANVTGISRADMKDNSQESFANYNGNARPGELVVNLSDYSVWVGNSLGYLNPVGGGGGNGTPGGANTQIQFNNAGSFGGSPSLTWDGANFTVGGNVLPLANVTYDLGSPTQQWKDLYMSGNTIYINSFPLSLANATTLTFNGNPLVAASGSNGVLNVSNLTVAGTIAGALAPGPQTGITQVGQLTSLTANAITVNNGLSVTGNTQFTGDMYIAGNVTLPGNIYQISGNSAQFYGEAANGFGALYAGIPSGYTLLEQEIMQFSASYNGYAQTTLRNLNGGDQATGDYVATADIGNQTTGFIDMGIAGSGFNGAVAGVNNGPGTVVNPLDGYLYVNGNAAASLYGNLVLATQLPNSSVKIAVGGLDAGNLSLTVNEPNTPAANTSTGTLVVAGDAGISGNVVANAFIGDGSQLTNLPVSVYSNSNVESYLANSNTTGDIYGGNITAIGNVTSNVYTIGVSGSLVDVTSGVVLSALDGTTGYSVGIQAGNATGVDSDGGTVALIAGTPTGTGNAGLIYLIGNASVTNDLTVVGNTVTSNVFGDVGTFNDVISNANVTANYFIGNGSQLTNLPMPNGIANANSNVTIGVADGPITMFDGGIPVATISSANIAIGANAGITSQGNWGVAIGYQAGQISQTQRAVAIGYSAGQNTQGLFSVAVGLNAGQTTQGPNGVALGPNCGRTSQGQQAVAIGDTAGSTSQGVAAVAIGRGAAQSSQGNNAVAIGSAPAGSNQGTGAIAIGYTAGQGAQGVNAIAIGYIAAQMNQGANAIAMGYQAGNSEQGINSIAIGALAGNISTANNSIILNASGNDLPSTNAGFYVKPTRNDTGNIGNVVFYNTSTSELTYANTLSVSSITTTGNVTVGSWGGVPQWWFRGTLSNNQSITSNVDTAINWNSNSDPLSWWNASTQRVTPTQSGWYEITSRILFSQNNTANTQQQLNHQIRLNGVSMCLTQAAASNQYTGQTLIATALVNLNGTTDYLDFSAYTSQTGETIGGGGGGGAGSLSQMYMRWISY